MFVERGGEREKRKEKLEVLFPTDLLYRSIFNEEEYKARKGW